MSPRTIVLRSHVQSCLDSHSGQSMAMDRLPVTNRGRCDITMLAPCRTPGREFPPEGRRGCNRTLRRSLRLRASAPARHAGRSKRHATTVANRTADVSPQGDPNNPAEVAQARPEPPHEWSAAGSRLPPHHLCHFRVRRHVLEREDNFSTLKNPAARSGTHPSDVPPSAPDPDGYPAAPPSPRRPISPFCGYAGGASQEQCTAVHPSIRPSISNRRRYATARPPPAPNRRHQLPPPAHPIPPIHRLDVPVHRPHRHPNLRRDPPARRPRHQQSQHPRPALLDLRPHGHLSRFRVRERPPLPYRRGLRRPRHLPPVQQPARQVRHKLVPPVPV